MSKFTTQEVKKKFREAYHKCQESRYNAISNNKEQNEFAFKQRMDELALVYASIAGLSVSEAQAVLESGKK